MKHWKTNEEMGEGYQYNEKEHKQNQYNSLLVVDKHENNTMRTKYLIRDVWDLDTLIDLKVHLDDIIQDKANIQDGIANLAEDAYMQGLTEKKQSV
tara:strand:- start:215 stop:502 length:288 start_codon:yes stop_codon:yes gene_type:complete